MQQSFLFLLCYLSELTKNISILSYLEFPLMIIIPSKSRIFHHKQLRLLINDNKNNQSILKHDTKTGENKTTNHSISPKLCFHTIISFLAILLVCFVLTGCSDNLSSSAQASENVVIKDTSVPLTNPSNLVDGLVSDPNIFDQENSESNGQEELVKLGIENPILEEPTAETGAENPASTAQEETYDGSPIITPEQEQAYDIEIGENQPNNVNWCLYEDGTLVINGSNEATYNGHTNIIAQGSNLNINNNYSDEAGNQVPWKAYRSNIVSIEFAAPTSPLSMAYWFYDCDKLTQINSENLDTSSVISLHSTFYGCESLTNLNGLGSWDVSNVQLFGDRVGGFTIGYGMFTGCSKLSDITAITNWKFDNSNRKVNCNKFLFDVRLLQFTFRFE